MALPPPVVAVADPSMTFWNQCQGPCVEFVTDALAVAQSHRGLVCPPVGGAKAEGAWNIAAKGFDRLARDGCSWRCLWPVWWRPRALNKAADLVAEVGHQGDFAYRIPDDDMAEILRTINQNEIYIRCFSDGACGVAAQFVVLCARSGVERNGG